MTSNIFFTFLEKVNIYFYKTDENSKLKQTRLFQDSLVLFDFTVVIKYKKNVSYHNLITQLVHNIVSTPI